MPPPPPSTSTRELILLAFALVLPLSCSQTSADSEDGLADAQGCRHISYIGETTSTEDATTAEDNAPPPCDLDGVCDPDEDAASCPLDCAPCVYDGVCDPALETPGKCPSQCPRTACDLDGIHDPLTEECDDGEPSLECNDDCTRSKCGDGNLNLAAGEECDDGNIYNNDGCTGTCVVEYMVFVSSAKYPPIDLANADQRCQELAESAALPGLYKAWLSDDDESPASRFGAANGPARPYVRTDGTRVSYTWDALTDGGILAPINHDEHGEPVTMTDAIWTGTDVMGLPTPFNCDGWLSTDGTAKATIGSMSTSMFWTSYIQQWSCNQSAHLYCFQVE